MQLKNEYEMYRMSNRDLMRYRFALQELEHCIRSAELNRYIVLVISIIADRAATRVNFSIDAEDLKQGKFINTIYSTYHEYVENVEARPERMYIPDTMFQLLSMGDTAQMTATGEAMPVINQVRGSDEYFFMDVEIVIDPRLEPGDFYFE